MQLQDEMLELLFRSTNNQGKRGNSIQTVKKEEVKDVVFQNFFITFMITNTSHLFVSEKEFELINWIFC